MIYDSQELGLSNKDSADRHRTAVDKLARLGTGAKCETWDPVHIILTTGIITYCGDFVELDDPAEAERMQMIFVKLLHRYIGVFFCTI